jgi:hypothetical protein
MRKLMIAGLAGVLVAVGAAGAHAQSPWPTQSLALAVTPRKAGTRAHPRAAKLSVRISWQTLSATSQPIVTELQILLSKGMYYNGAHVKSCSLAALSAHGPRGCPSASVVGAGSGTANAYTAIKHPTITIVNGGGDRVYFFTVLDKRAHVQAPAIGMLTPLTGTWSYRLDVSVPQALQVVAGEPIALRTLNFTAGAGSWLETTACPAGGKWQFHLIADYVDPNTGSTGSSMTPGSVPCRK